MVEVISLQSRSGGELEKAAKAGYVEAMLILAKRKLDQCLEGYGIESFVAGLEWYEKAADTDCLDAVAALAEIYSFKWRNYPIPPDFGFSFDTEYDRLEAVLRYYEQAARLGCEWSAAQIVSVQERLKKLEDEDQDNSEPEPPT